MKLHDIHLIHKTWFYVFYQDHKPDFSDNTESEHLMSELKTTVSRPEPLVRVRGSNFDPVRPRIYHLPTFVLHQDS